MKKNLLSVWFLALVCLPIASCKPKEVQVQAQAGSSLGSILAEETIRAAGTKKNVVIIAQKNGKGTISSAETEFRNALKKNGVTIIATLSPDLGDPMRYDDYGLRSRDFIDALEKFPEAGAIVSFVGVPHLQPTQFANVPATHPPVLVVAVASLGEVPGVTTNIKMLPQLLAAKIIQIAIVDGPGSPTTNANSTDDAHKLFSQNFQIYRASLPIVP